MTTVVRQQQQPIRSTIPARLDRLRWSPFHTRLVLGLGTAWVLDGLSVTIASSVSSKLTQPNTLNLTTTQAASIGTVYLIGEVVGASSPVAIREALTAAARAMAGAAKEGFSIATPMANAAAFAACPDGKDGLDGCGSRRAAGTSTSGRRRADRPLPTRLAVALAAARLPRPRHAARRAHRSPVAHSAPATTIHRTPRSAIRDKAGMTRSSVRESASAMRLGGGLVGRREPASQG